MRVHEPRHTTDEQAETIVLCLQLDRDVLRVNSTERRSTKKTAQRPESTGLIDEARHMLGIRNGAVEREIGMPTEFERFAGAPPGFDRTFGMLGVNEKDGSAEPA